MLLLPLFIFLLLLCFFEIFLSKDIIYVPHVKWVSDTRTKI